MAKGYHTNQLRKEALVSYGKEIPPVNNIAEVEKTLFLCERCENGVDGGKLQPEKWRFMEAVVWHQLSAAQVASVRICKRLAEQEIAWASVTISNLCLEPKIEEWILSG